MESGIRRIRRIFEYCGARIFLTCLAWLPWKAAHWLGRRLGDVWLLVDAKRRKTVELQSTERLGLPPNEIRSFTRRTFRNIGMVFAEFARLSRLRREDFFRYVDFAGFDGFCRSLLSEGCGLVIVTAHYGNWEWGNAIAGLLGASGGSIARPLDNPRLDGYVKKIRERNGLRIYDKQGALRQALRTLRNNGVVGVLLDQDAGSRGLMSPFLGRLASTVPEPVELALRAGSPLVAAVLRRSADGRRFVVRYNPIPHRPNPDRSPDETIRELVNDLNSDLSRFILEEPDQWFWIHRRWKSTGRESLPARNRQDRR
ncbi:MAG: lysophospholipid acyltransferase family protein [Planctomycetota bacterium]|jgi:KDO2-lipid IV(A) lauroyltransferase|nr:lysophospholipid acyltransferase family protein [Planctomycetota bacterium]